MIGSVPVLCVHQQLHWMRNMFCLPASHCTTQGRQQGSKHSKQYVSSENSLWLRLILSLLMDGISWVIKYHCLTISREALPCWLWDLLGCQSLINDWASFSWYTLVTFLRLCNPLDVCFAHSPLSGSTRAMWPIKTPPTMMVFCFVPCWSTSSCGSSMTQTRFLHRSMSCATPTQVWSTKLSFTQTAVNHSHWNTHILNY